MKYNTVNIPSVLSVVVLSILLCMSLVITFLVIRVNSKEIAELKELSSRNSSRILLMLERARIEIPEMPESVDLEPVFRTDAEDNAND